MKPAEGAIVVGGATVVVVAGGITVVVTGAGVMVPVSRGFVSYTTHHFPCTSVV